MAGCIGSAGAQVQDPYIFLVLRASKYVQFNSRYIDTFDDDKGQYIFVDPGPYARLFVKYRSSSESARFFQAGVTYTWRGPSTRLQNKLQGHYGHYTVEGWVPWQNIRQQFPTTCWRDLTRTHIDNQAGLTYLRGSTFIASAVNWNFRWEANTPERVAQWRWPAPPAPDNLMDLPLHALAASDIRHEIGSKSIDAMIKGDRHPIDVPAFMSQYGPLIEKAAQQNALHPEVLAAILIAEQRDQKDEIGVFVKNIYLGTYSAETTKKLGGYLGWMLNMDASIGLGQIRPRTVQQFNLGGAGNLTTPRITGKLSEPEFNIAAAAQYARIIANAGARYTKRDYQTIFAGRSDKTFMAGLNLADFAKHSLDWKPGHLILLGSEYTSTMWDGKYKPYWGLNVLRAYQDALAWNVCQ